jgi:hypothetical protein
VDLAQGSFGLFPKADAEWPLPCTRLPSPGCQCQEAKRFIALWDSNGGWH